MMFKIPIAYSRTEISEGIKCKKCKSSTMVFKMAAEIISVLWRLFNVIFLTYLCNSEMDGCIGCQYKERQTGKKSKL